MHIKELFRASGGGTCLLATCESQYELTSTFARIQEFYESPNPQIKNNYFTLENLMDAYAKQHGNWTYNSDWNGFNIPDSYIRKFFSLFHDLSTREKQMHDMLIKYIESNVHFYLIGVHSEESEIEHELAHALYYINPFYTYRMNTFTQEWKKSTQFKENLIKDGYCQEVLDDEVQAYLATSTKTYLVKRFGFKWYWKMPTEYKKLFIEFKKKHVP
jgi:hypothetical protein